MGSKSMKRPGDCQKRNWCTRQAAASNMAIKADTALDEIQRSQLHLAIFPPYPKAPKYCLCSDKPHPRDHLSNHVYGQYGEILFLQGHGPERPRPPALACGFGISDSQR
ncbi:hypothetical protein BDDG_12101 [Blastomyces dermatitidis ATCC 18188]|uniref:Uncharacterized protein n=1 Tax=Ajellomyces dermatitidis (strain ATCC 18188 / CBS 674.68) TaxID=653446 RepID=A0A0J9EMS7_AJEDA|nr:hypothetical protein BDDG_12101 [Blastomyces dermatitidis ATCC 18188]